MSKFGLIDAPIYSVHLEFRPSVYPGNVYTAYRSYIHDFGWGGLVVLPVVFSICANWLYYVAVRAAKTKIFVVGLVVYALVIYPIFADFVRCFFFLKFFNVNMIPIALGIFLLPWFLKKLGWLKLVTHECNDGMTKSSKFIAIRDLAEKGKFIRIPFIKSILLLAKRNRKRVPDSQSRADAGSSKEGDYASTL